MKIGILGSGIVGRVLATAFIAEGHDVQLGTRDTSKEDVQKWMKENPAGKVGTFQETARFAEIVVLAVMGEVASEVLSLSGGNEVLQNKIVIDATNPISHQQAPANGVLSFFTSYNQSLMEQLQKQVPAARFVKAFNSVGNALMYKPKLSIAPTMFICGNDEDAKKQVTALLHSFGWETEDMGMAESARAIEPLCILWCIPGFLNNQWSHAFKLIKA